MGAWRPKHVEWPCRNKTCTVLHQVGGLCDLYYDARKHKSKKKKDVPECGQIFTLTRNVSWGFLLCPTTTQGTVSQPHYVMVYSVVLRSARRPVTYLLTDISPVHSTYWPSPSLLRTLRSPCGALKKCRLSAPSDCYSYHCSTDILNLFTN